MDSSVALGHAHMGTSTSSHLLAHHDDAKGLALVSEIEVSADVGQLTFGVRVAGRDRRLARLGARAHEAVGCSRGR
jgi:hypothetical protein